MLDYKIITKRDYVHELNSKYLSVKEYLIIEKNRKRYLLLKLVNKSRQNVREFCFDVVQKTINGDFIATNEYKKSDVKFKPLRSFIPDVVLEISNKCEDIYLELKSVVFDRFLIDNGKKYTISSFKGKKVQSNSNIVSKKYLPKLPYFIAVSFLCLICIVSLISVVGVTRYKKDRYVFNIDDFKYEFLSENEKDSPIRIVSYSGKSEFVTIPDYIKGHKIISVENNAFMNNNNVRGVKFDGEIEIKDKAFKNCSSLYDVDFKNIKSVGKSAFENTNVNKVESDKIISIGANAFLNCNGLLTVKINNENEKVTIGSNAFKDCTFLKNVMLTGEMENGERIFDGCTSIANLDIDDFSYLGRECVKLSKIFANNDDYDCEFQNVSIGHMPYIPTDFAKGISTLETITVKDVDLPVIPEHAFEDCHKLKQANFSGVITKIGQSAFKGTNILKFDGRNLKEINDSAFEDCKYLSNIELTDNLLSIGKNAFRQCENLDMIYLSINIDRIKPYTFAGCKNLKSINIDYSSKIKTIDEGAFSDCEQLVSIDLPSNLENLGKVAFMNCKSLINIKIPYLLTVIEDGAFYGCNKLEEFKLFVDVETKKSNITHIGKSAFKGCYSLSECNLPHGVEYIDVCAFENCYGLERIILPDTLKHIENSVFFNCRNLYEIVNYANLDLSGYDVLNYAVSIITDEAEKLKTFKSGNCRFAYIDDFWMLVSYPIGIYVELPEIVEYENKEVTYNVKKNLFVNCQLNQDLYIPNNVNSIGEKTFYNSGLTSVECEENASLKYIGRNAFSHNNLTKVTLNKNLEYMGKNAFAYSNVEELIFPSRIKLEYLGDGAFIENNITKLILPYGVRTIGDYAFYNSNKLNSVTIPSTIKTIGNESFAKCDILYEVYNLSSLELELNSDEYGQIAKEAIVINKRSSDKPLEYTTISNMNFALNDKVCVLINYKNNGDNIEKLELPKVVSSDDYTHYTYSIRKNAFAYNNFNEVHIPASIKSIGSNAFCGINNLNKLTFEDGGNLQSIGDRAFANNTSVKEIYLPSSLRHIGNRVFESNYSLRLVYIPYNVYDIGEGAFAYCDSLLEIFNLPVLDLSNTGHNAMFVHTVREDKFIRYLQTDQYDFWAVKDNCELRKTYGVSSDLSLPEKVQVEDRIFTSYKVNDYAINTFIQKLVIPSAVREFGENAFYNTYLKEITFKSNSNFYKIPFRLFSGMSSLETVTLPEETREIGAESFYGCNNLVTVNMSDKVRKIGNSAFRYCNSLTTHFELDNLTSIGENAFNGCYSLKSFTLPRNITSFGIGYGAFFDCFNLVYIENKSNLNLVKGSDNYGGIAKYALVIDKEYDKEPFVEMFTVYCNDNFFYFTGINGVAYLTSAEGLVPTKGVVVFPSDISGKIKYNYYTITSYFTKSGMSKIYLPINVNKIEKNAFVNYLNLQEIYYQGSQEKWKKIEIDDYSIAGIKVKYLAKFENNKWEYQEEKIK